MKILLDDKPFTGQLEGVTLQDVLGDLVERELGGERIIREVKINGELFESRKLGSAEDLGREAIDLLEVETIASKEVALHFLANAGQFLDTIKSSITRVSELFRVGDEKEANEMYLQTLESLQLFLQVLQISRETLNLDFDNILHKGVSAEEKLNKLSGLVGELLSAQEDEDWVLLADILEYDLNQELSDWDQIAVLLKEQTVS